MDAILANPKSGGDVLLWAAQLAEKSEDYARAEMMYQLCRKRDDRWKKIANVYLARLLSLQKRTAEAQIILQQHLHAFPNDSYAVKLAALLGR